MRASFLRSACVASLGCVLLVCCLPVCFTTLGSYAPGRTLSSASGRSSSFGEAQRTKFTDVGMSCSALAAGLLSSLAAASLTRRPAAKGAGVARGHRERACLVGRRFFGEEEYDDPYATATAMKVQVGLQFSRQLLETLNNLADTADTSTQEGLHQLLLDVVVALRRAEPSWRYGYVDRLFFNVDDDGARQATSALQKWGVDAQLKFGDGQDWEKLAKDTPKGVTDFLVVTLMVACYGPLVPDVEELKVMSFGDMKKVLESASGIQSDELIQIDVQWIPEEEGDTLSAMEMTVKFPEMAIL